MYERFFEHFLIAGLDTRKMQKRAERTGEEKMETDMYDANCVQKRKTC